MIVLLRTEIFVRVIVITVTTIMIVVLPPKFGSNQHAATNWDGGGMSPARISLGPAMSCVCGAVEHASRRILINVPTPHGDETATCPSRRPSS